MLLKGRNYTNLFFKRKLKILVSKNIIKKINNMKFFLPLLYKNLLIFIFISVLFSIKNKELWLTNRMGKLVFIKQSGLEKK